MLESIIAFLVSNSAVSGIVGTLAVNQVIRMLPVKPNSLVDLFAHVMVKIGTAILDKGASADSAATVAPAAPAKVVQPAAIAAVQPRV